MIFIFLQKQKIIIDRNNQLVKAILAIKIKSKTNGKNKNLQT